MKKGPSRILYFLLLLLAAVTFWAFLCGAIHAEFLYHPDRVWKRLLWPLIRLTSLISVGLLAAQIIEGLGWTDRLAVMARPFMRWGHLTDQMGAVFTASFFSGTASLSMLMSFHKDGMISRKEVTCSVLLNTFPTFFLHLPTTFFILLPLAGTAGALYLGITFAAALLRLGAILIFTRVSLPPAGGGYVPAEPKRKWLRDLLKETLKKFRTRIGRILMIVLPVYVVISVVSEMGFFGWLRDQVAYGISSRLVPVEAMSVVIFSLMAEFTSGYAAAGAMLEAGTLSTSETVLALLVGNILAAPIRAVRHQLPYYMGIFTPGMGTWLMIASQAYRILSLILVGLVFILVMAFIH